MSEADPKETSVELPSKEEAKQRSCEYGDENFVCGDRPVVARTLDGYCLCRQHSMMVATAGVALEIL